MTGKGGIVLARKMKGQPNDGQTIGIAVTESFNYSMLATKKAGYTEKDFTYITTTAGSQMGIYARKDKGWKSWDDVIKAAKSGKQIKFGGMSPKHADIMYLLGRKAGVKFNPVLLRGGRAVLNAVTAGDVDFGFWRRYSEQGHQGRHHGALPVRRNHAPEDQPQCADLR